MRAPDRQYARDLLGFIDRSPTPYHAVAEARARLEAAGFTALDPTAPWPGPGGQELVTVGGTLVAWALAGQPAEAPFRMVGAHTDSPNLRLKPIPDTESAGFRRLGVEVYGGVLLNSWLDRDLGLAGRVAVRGPGDRPQERLFRHDGPLARIPQLAIHLDREVNDKGLVLDRQRHLVPVWGVGPSDTGSFREWLAGELGVLPADVLGWDLMFHDVVPGTFLGAGQELLSAPRLDNLLSCHAAVSALVEAAATADGSGPVPLIVLFDHEEVGSTSAVGATSNLLRTVIERLVARRGGGPEDVARSLAGSLLVSGDNAHATHPNYAERHEPSHPVRCNGGPVIKRNANVRYATDAATEAEVVLAAGRAEVPVQRYVVRSDMPCGSTIGPLTAAALGVATVDVGAPQLAMHSAREMAGVADPGWLAALFTALLTPPG